jgi:hypothetical protein
MHTNRIRLTIRLAGMWIIRSAWCHDCGRAFSAARENFSRSSFKDFKTNFFSMDKPAG